MQPTYQHIPFDCLIYPYGQLSAVQHLHSSFEIAAPRVGHMQARLNGEEYLVNPGDLLVVFPGVIHSYGPQTNGDGLMVICSDKMLPQLEEAWLDMQPAEPVIRIRDQDEDVAYCLRRLGEMMSGGVDEALARSYLSLLCVRLIPALGLKESAKTASKDILYRAMIYMTQNLAAPLSLKGTAQALGVNSYYLSHALNERLGMGFRNYLNTLRITRARRYLRGTAHPIEEIAAACGFANLRTFDRVFVERCGCTPRDYRKAGAQRGAQLAGSTAKGE